jgi:hypothetical protein
MSEIVNLRTARKRAKRREAEQQAAANRHVHGRSKQELTLARAIEEKAQHSLDGHRIETGDGQ